MFAAVKLPEKYPLPWTERVVKGEVVPTPSVAKPVMFCPFPVTAPPRVKAGSVVENEGTLDPLVTRMELAAALVTCRAPAALPNKTPLVVKEAAPVPPPPTPRSPAKESAKVRVPPELVIVVEAVSPLNAVEDVAKMMAPVSTLPGTAIEVTPALVSTPATSLSPVPRRLPKREPLMKRLPTPCVPVVVALPTSVEEPTER
jgi:hypothetical protein